MIVPFDLVQSGLILTTEELQKKYRSFDVDENFRISAEEASEMPNEALASLLVDSFEEQADPANNGHALLINDLPASRVASLFADSQAHKISSIPDHYFVDYVAANATHAASVVHYLSTHFDKDVNVFTEPFLMQSEVPLAQWDSVWHSLLASPSDIDRNAKYVQRSTSIAYGDLLVGNPLLNADDNQDGILTKNELGQLPRDQLNEVVDLFVQGGNSPSHRVATHYLLGKMDPTIRGTLMKNIALRSEKLKDKIKADDKDFAERTAEAVELAAINQLFEKTILLDARGTFNGVIVASVAVNPNISSIVGRYVEKDLSKRANQLWANAASNRLKENLDKLKQLVSKLQNPTSSTETEQKSFIVEGTYSAAENDFGTEVLESKMPVLVIFGASWCGVCHQSIPTIQEIAKEYKGVLKVVTVDGDQNEKLSELYQVRGYPSFILMKKGVVLDVLRGFESSTLKNILNQHIQKPKDI